MIQSFCSAFTESSFILFSLSSSSPPAALRRQQQSSLTPRESWSTLTSPIVWSSIREETDVFTLPASSPLSSTKAPGRWDLVNARTHARTHVHPASVSAAVLQIKLGGCSWTGSGWRCWHRNTWWLSEWVSGWCVLRIQAGRKVKCYT